MLHRQLRQIANESIFNPNKADPIQKILLDVGNTTYYITRAKEHLETAKLFNTGSEPWHGELRNAITLLILARATSNEIHN